MNIPDHLQDPLASLRELRSPVSANAIRERVLERVAAISLWSQLRSVMAEALVVGVVAATVLLNMAGPSAHDVPNSSHLTYRPDLSGQIAANFTSSPVVTQTQVPVAASRIARASDQALASFAALELPSRNLQPTSSILQPLSLNLQPSSLILQPSSLILHPSAPEMKVAASNHWFACVSGGATFSELRIMAERGELGFQDGWKTIAVSFTNSNGSRDIHDELVHHPGLTAPFLSNESEQQYSLLLGGTTDFGPVEVRALAGPAYLYSSSSYYAPATGADGAPVSAGALGVSAEVSAFYNISREFQAGITGITCYTPQAPNLRRASGLFVSFNYRFGQ